MNYTPSNCFESRPDSAGNRPRLVPYPASSVRNLRRQWPVEVLRLEDTPPCVVSMDRREDRSAIEEFNLSRANGKASGRRVSNWTQLRDLRC